MHKDAAVPIRFDLANFHDQFGDELLGVCRYNKRGTTEPTETVELVFDSIDTAHGHYNRRGTKEPTETVELVFDSIDTARGHYNRDHMYC